MWPSGCDVHVSRACVRSVMTVVRFDPTGRYIFAGTSAGSVLVFNTRTKTVCSLYYTRLAGTTDIRFSGPSQMIARHKISGAGIIRGLDFAKGGRYALIVPLYSLTTYLTSRRLVTNSSDRTLRQFNLPVYATSAAEGEYIEQELEPTYRFNDPINKNAWHAMAYSPDGEWLAGGGVSECCKGIRLRAFSQVRQTMHPTKSTYGTSQMRASLRRHSTAGQNPCCTSTYVVYAQ